MMKKVFLLLLLLIVSSCGYAPIDNSRYIIITAVESYDSNFSDKGSMNKS